MPSKGQVPKSIVLGTDFSGRASVRKGPAGLGLLALIRCGIPLSGG